MRHLVRSFVVAPDAPAAPPVALEDRHIEAGTLEEARLAAREVFATEHRPVRSLSFLADGGLVAYVLPPLPASERDTADERPKRRRRPRGRR